jgi:hypothetical protein
MPASPLVIDDPVRGDLMRMPWSKTTHRTVDSAPSMTNSQASLSGPEGDGKVHDLQYWLDSGFLTLPKDPGRTGM